MVDIMFLKRYGNFYKYGYEKKYYNSNCKLSVI